MPEAPRPRAAVLRAFVHGWRRTITAPVLLLVTWAVMTLATLPASSLLAADAPAGLSGRTWALDGVGGVIDGRAAAGGAALGSEIGGVGALAAVLVRSGVGSPASAAALAVYFFTWIFASGAAADRLARGRAVGGAALTGLGARYFPRLLRLALVAGLGWGVLLGAYPLLAGRSDGSGLASSLGGILFVAVAALFALVIDFTRVRIVVEDRHSVLSALAAGLRFVRRRFRGCVGLYALQLATLAVLAAVWGALVAPSATLVEAQGLTIPAWLAFRLTARFALTGSQIAFFQAGLAHAGYAAAPVPRWPESASIEAIRNLRSG